MKREAGMQSSLYEVRMDCANEKEKELEEREQEVKQERARLVESEECIELGKAALYAEKEVWKSQKACLKEYDAMSNELTTIKCENEVLRVDLKIAEEHKKVFAANW